MSSSDRPSEPLPDKPGWHHAPLHRFEPGGAYMITAGTLNKRPLFIGDTRLSLLEDTLLGVFREHGWQPQAWAVFPNHYHCVALAPAGDAGLPLRDAVRCVHSLSARELNRLDGAPGRRVWFQYWDTRLTYEKSYYARINYTQNNAVKHGLVARAEQYAHCSAAWFSQNADDVFRRKVATFGYGRVSVADDFD